MEPPVEHVIPIKVVAWTVIRVVPLLNLHELVKVLLPMSFLLQGCSLLLLALLKVEGLEHPILVFLS